MPISKSALNALIEHIKEQGPAVLASPEDADYFRKVFRKQDQEKPEPALLKPLKPAPVPAKTEPVKEASSESPQPEVLKKEKKIEPLKPIAPMNLSQVRNIISIVAPELAILDEIPSDEIGKKLSERWKTKNQSAPISILVYQEPAEQRAFLMEIAKAIDIYFGPAKIVNAEGIEKEKQWEAFLSVDELKMVIVCDYTLWQLGNLMHFYKETPAQGTRLLGNIPLFLLPDLSLYLKDALLKRSLWKALCQKCM